MPEPDFEGRLGALEAKVAELADEARAARQDAAAARHLAAANDRDVERIRTDLRTFRQARAGSFTAMRDDLNDLRNETRNGFVEIRGKFDQAAAGQDQILRLLNALIESQDPHGREGAPVARAR